MAKNTGIKITIATLAVIVGIVVGGWRLLGGVWSQGGTHAVQAKQLDIVVEDVRVLKPDVAELKIEVNTLKIKQDAILEGVDKIQKKMGI